ncbi:hypothetical protein ACFFGR_09375 [Arthrobacter liuii]|uniref:Uncharacterized protein n=1 Tax=Arthrobacter liuii TaxID=1476996 RepID=A0ABQ2AM85_9MICC|nr:hypothetical protein [Arthrobacter liuii]GGH93868.1 hypothetical protein GCM10007170_15740 [Arthrobacter liuii]
MNGNDHFQYALDALGDRRNSPEAAATLALAYEQRTANLIAWAAGGQPTPELREMIAARLGLA